MANHVRTTIEVTKLSKETADQLKEKFRFLQNTRIGSQMFGTEQTEDYGSESLSIHNFFDDGVAEWDFYVNRIGSKWCHIEDAGATDDGFYLELESAWSYPQPFVESFVRTIENLQEGSMTFVTYEDEMPNFAGAEVYEGDTLVDGWEDDIEEINATAAERDPRFGELIAKEEEDELSEEEEEELSDIRWEAINEVIWNQNHDLFESWRNE